MELNAPAKINWDLHVLGKRPDGYHELDTVMVTLGLSDRLAIEPGAELSLSCSDPALPCDERNLVIRAARKLSDASGAPARAKMHLEKRIPAGGGLGGGSSDAAAALKGLNELWGLHWPRERLARVAAEVGSDVAFFLWGGWCRCRGRGEIVEPLPGAEDFPALRVALLIPEFGVSTPRVYAQLAAPSWAARTGWRCLTAVAQNVKLQFTFFLADRPLDEWSDNHLLQAACRAEPRLQDMQRTLRQVFPGRWQMSGSGAVHFVIPPLHDEHLDIVKRIHASLRECLNVVETTTV